MKQFDSACAPNRVPDDDLLGLVGSKDFIDVKEALVFEILKAERTGGVDEVSSLKLDQSFFTLILTFIVVDVALNGSLHYINEVFFDVDELRNVLTPCAFCHVGNVEGFISL